ncbi:uncharacterized protein LOC100255283 isoform X1 [Vitis vinifera]|nr:uncharacterized protein LOC100255283 isoform X1 [Vitis vinifera]|eukprot:XP_002268977.1 PREDICTED: protein prenyltransferase alpha subunit repeat-containing protein 1 isoform X1 [Vitis vinifera]
MTEEEKGVDLLNQLEHILESDPLIDEVGFIHPSQFFILNEEAGGVLPSSNHHLLQSEDGISSFWNRDHKLGISIDILLPLYRAAKNAFMAAIAQYKAHGNPSVKEEKSGDENISCHLESEVMKHSRALLLLSSDFGTAWNSRKLVLSKKQDLSMFMDEFLLSALVLSYSPKSEQAWSHRRWVIKMIAGNYTYLQEVLGKESELVEKIAEKSKMNYRAWNHRCWLVFYMTGEQVLHELDKSRSWAGLHVADNCCFHYRRRLMLRILECSCYKQDPNASSGYNIEIYRVWKEELDWNKMLIERYIGREGLWLHRRFLSLCWIKHFATDGGDLSCHSELKTDANHDISNFLDNEIQYVHSCLAIPSDDFEDVETQAVFSATYILWLTKQMYECEGIELQQKQLIRGGELKILLKKHRPEKSFLWDSII